jgi:hypothetical protein
MNLVPSRRKLERHRRKVSPRRTLTSGTTVNYQRLEQSLSRRLSAKTLNYLMSCKTLNCQRPGQLSCPLPVLSDTTLNRHKLLKGPRGQLPGVFLGP